MTYRIDEVYIPQIWLFGKPGVWPKSLDVREDIVLYQFYSTLFLGYPLYIIVRRSESFLSFLGGPDIIVPNSQWASTSHRCILCCFREAGGLDFCTHLESKEGKIDENLLSSSTEPWNRKIQLQFTIKGFGMAPRSNCASQPANDPTVATHDTQVSYFPKNVPCSLFL